MLDREDESKQQRRHDRLLERSLPVVGGGEVRQRAHHSDDDPSPWRRVTEGPGGNHRRDHDDRQQQAAEDEVERRSDGAGHHCPQAGRSQRIAVAGAPQVLHARRAQALGKEEEVSRVIVQAHSLEPDAPAGQEGQRRPDQRHESRDHLYPVARWLSSSPQEGGRREDQDRGEGHRGHRAPRQLDRGRGHDDQCGEPDPRRRPPPLPSTGGRADRLADNGGTDRDEQRRSVGFEDHSPAVRSPSCRRRPRGPARGCTPGAARCGAT